MLKYLDNLVTISNKSDAPATMKEKGNTLSFKFNALQSISLNGIIMEINSSEYVELDTNKVSMTITKTHDGKNGYKSVTIELKYDNHGSINTVYFNMYTSKIVLHYNKEIDVLDIQSTIFPDKKYNLLYNNSGMCILEDSEDLKYFLEDYPNTNPNVIINEYGNIYLSYMYGLDDCFDKITHDKDKPALLRLSELKSAYVTYDYAIFPRVDNIGVLLKAYTDIVLAFHLKYNPVIYEYDNIKPVEKEKTKLSLACIMLYGRILMEDDK